MKIEPNEIIDLWFSEQIKPLWFASTPEFDNQLETQFLPLCRAALAGELDGWTTTGTGSLALVILLDQFLLNIFRDQLESFSGEFKAREIAAIAIERGQDVRLAPEQKAFLYLPFMHSESLADQDRSIKLFELADLEENLKFAHHHRSIIVNFGRFPHRNRILGRKSTPEELNYLSSDEAFLG